MRSESGEIRTRDQRCLGAKLALLNQFCGGNPNDLANNHGYDCSVRLNC